MDRCCRLAMLAFVNTMSFNRYADAARDVFKAPARLESMMQDYPLGLPAEEKVGFCKYGGDTLQVVEARY